MRIISFLLGLILGCAPLVVLAEPQYGVAMHGDLKYPANFHHFAYVNADAPKGGTLRLSALGGFDSLNPFIVKGDTAPGLNMLDQGLLYESLMTQSVDEPFSMYGLIAQTIDIAPDRRHVTFGIDPRARWHDGQKITADDVAWTFETMMKVGSPFFRAYFGDVGQVTVDAPDRVTFAINNPQNRELPLVLSQLVVLPKHYWTAPGHDISTTSLTPPLSSGPYQISEVRPGMRIVYTRVKDWWGADLPVNRGRYNFDRIVFDTYRDPNVSMEAFFAHQYDVRVESIAKLWATGYTAAPVKDGRIAKQEIPNAVPAGMQAFAFNTRRPIFQDARVREAIALTFDFEWTNKQLTDAAYTRTDSFFENSELASPDLPAGRELAILEKFRGQLPDDLFTHVFKPSITDGSGNNRTNLRTAAALLEAAGYTLGKDGIRVNADGKRLDFEFLYENPAYERWIQPFAQNLKKVGVRTRLRFVDSAQYQNRMDKFDFDMTMVGIGQSDSPGNEQIDYWQSAKADVPGSRNIIGVKNAVVDNLIQQIIQAENRDELVAATRALDRVLLWNHYVVPGWHYPKWRVAWWKQFDYPKAVTTTRSLGVADVWWAVPPSPAPAPIPSDKSLPSDSKQK